MNSSSKNSAFTLIELLVVISIILIASSIIFIGGGGGDGAKLSSSQRIISGIAQGARGQAILKNAKVRLIIYSDDTSNLDDDKKLRFFGIVYWGNDVDKDGEVTATGWKAATQGTLLPEGIYFNPDGGPNADSNPWPKSSSKMTLDYPRIKVGDNKDRESGGGSEEYYYFEFSANGTMGSDYDNAWLVMQAGTLKPGSGGALGVDFTEIENEGLKAALIFRRVGTTTPVSDPADIK